MKTRAYPPIKALHDVITFGKYKGHDVQWIVELHPDYLLWLADEKICKVDKRIYSKANAKALRNITIRLKNRIIRTGKYWYENMYPDDDVWSYFDPH